MALRQLVLLLSALYCSGCMAAPVRYSTAVSSLAAPAASRNSSYLVLPGNPGIDSLNLQFLEAKAYLELALSDQGFVRAPRAEDADLVLFLNYGIGDPTTNQASYVMPVFGQAPGSTSTTTGTVTAGGRTATVNTQTQTQPNFGLQGYRTVTQTYTTYTRYALVVAIDLKRYRRDQTVQEVWRSAVVSTGSSGDLRLVLPILFVALEPYLGRRTDRMISADIAENDPRIARMRAAVSSPPDTTPR